MCSLLAELRRFSPAWSDSHSRSCKRVCRRPKADSEDPAQYGIFSTLKDEREAHKALTVIVEYEVSSPRPTHSALGNHPMPPQSLMLSEIHGAMETSHMAA